MKYMIPIVQRTFAIVRAIAANQGTGSVHQLARDMGMSPSTCFRIIRTLQAEGWIAEKRTGGWELSVGLAHLLEGLAPWQRLVEVSREPLNELAERVRLACKLSVRQGDQAVTMLRADSPAGIALSGRVGARFPLTVGSSGAVLSADMTDEQLSALIERTPTAWATQSPEDFLKRVNRARAGKMVIDLGSYSPHVHTASIAVTDRGETIAALTVLGMPDDLSRKKLSTIEKALSTAAAQIQRRLPAAGKILS